MLEKVVACVPLVEDDPKQVSAVPPVVSFGFGPLELSFVMFPVSLGVFPTASQVVFLVLDLIVFPRVARDSRSTSTEPRM